MLTEEGIHKMILDGQQRATSIALGFYNPWKDSEISRIGNAKNLPTVWIDVLPPEKKSPGCAFVFRATTRSHPWGYQLTQNTKTLSIPDRITAAENFSAFFEKEIYTQLSAAQRLPYDACLPVPLCFLLEASNESSNYLEWKQNIINRCSNCIPIGFTPKLLPGSSYHEALKNCDMEKIYSIVKDRLDNYRIPSIVVDNKLILTNEDNATNDPTLFVRLNSAGTNLEGEELIYSIYKAICPESKDLVENIGNNIVAPSRIITITARLIQSIITGKYVQNINLVQFQKYVADEEFLSFFKELAGTRVQDSKLGQLFSKAIKILKYDDESIPDVIIKKFVRDSPNGLLILLHWLYFNDTEISLTRRKNICSQLYQLYWFGDIDNAVKTTWADSKELEFWDKPVKNTSCIIKYPLATPDSIQDFLLQRLERQAEDHNISRNDTEIWQLWENAFRQPESMSLETYEETIRNGWLNFMYRLLTNKSLILLAQREYINREFREFNQIEDLQDSNTPWDWDHIYPASWVYNKHDIDPRTRKWEWRIGNFRAMSLTDNRSENNNESPAERFKQPDKDYFILENDFEFWKQLTQEHKNIKKLHTEHVLIHAKAIIQRTVNIYREFYELFVTRQA